MTRTHETRAAGISTRAARWSIRHPWWAIGLWVAFVATTAVLGGMTGTRQASDADLSVGDSGRAERMIDSATFDDDRPTENILITAPGTWDAAAAEAAAADTAGRLARLPEVVAVGEPVPSPVADALLLPITLARDGAGADRIEPVVAAVAQVDTDHPRVRVEAVGGASIWYGVDEVVQADLGTAGMLSLPVTLTVLLVVFGALAAAGVPLLLSFSAVAAATGLWAFASHVVPDIGTVPQVILLFGLAVGVDYSLFYLKREREERARGRGTVDAVRIAAATSGRAVVVSGLTSLVALAGLYLAGDAIFAALGTGVILAVAVAMLGSVTVLPALLVKLGRAVDRPRVPLLWRLTHQGDPGREPRVWSALLAPALRAPRTTLVMTVAGLVALAVPALGMSLKNSTAEDLPRSIPVMQAYDRLLAAFPGEGNAHTVVVAAPAGQVEAVRAALGDLAARAGQDPLFVPDAAPPVRTSADHTVSIVDLAVPYAEAAPEAELSLARLRADLAPAALAGIPGVEYAVGGVIAENLDYTSHQVRRLPWVIGFVVLLTVGMMALAFRSLVVAAVAGGLAVLSVAAAFGLLTLVFQHWWDGATGHIVNWVPLFLFVVLFGLSMDYHVFVVSRIRDAVAAGMATAEAVRVGIVRTAGVVTSAAAVMVAVFTIFATMSLIEMKQLGVGLAAAIAIDALVVRILLLPSIMTLLGRANWWPSRLARAAQVTAGEASVATVPPPRVQTGVSGQG